MAKIYKNDIFELIKHIDNKDYQYFELMEDDKKKEVQPYILMRWISTTNDSKHEKFTLNINNNVNKHFWELSKYKDLQWKLLCTCGEKKWAKHQWVALTKISKDKEKTIIRQFYQNLNNQDFELKYKFLTKEEKEKIFQFLGLRDKI
jgi:hypothetical protein